MLAARRPQMLKLIKHLIAVGAKRMPRSVCMALISVADDAKSDDRTFRRACLEALRDLSVRNAVLVAHCSGFRPIVEAMLTSDSETFAESLTYGLLFVLNNPATRCLLRPSLDLQGLFAPFTDGDGDPTVGLHTLLLPAARCTV